MADLDRELRNNASIITTVVDQLLQNLSDADKNFHRENLLSLRKEETILLQLILQHRKDVSGK